MRVANIVEVTRLLTLADRTMWKPRMQDTPDNPYLLGRGEISIRCRGASWAAVRIPCLFAVLGNVKMIRLRTECNGHMWCEHAQVTHVDDYGFVIEVTHDWDGEYIIFGEPA